MLSPSLKRSPWQRRPTRCCIKYTVGNVSFRTGTAHLICTTQARGSQPWLHTGLTHAASSLYRCPGPTRHLTELEWVGCGDCGFKKARPVTLMPQPRRRGSNGPGKSDRRVGCEDGPAWKSTLEKWKLRRHLTGAQTAGGKTHTWGSP